MAAIVFPSAAQILTGESLVPLLPRYHVLFDECLSKIETDIGSAIDHLNQGVASLQQAIENKKTYRLQTKIPAWVYSVFDWMGWGAVSQAEKQLHRVILEVFERTSRSSGLKECIPAFLHPLKACYLQKYSDHALLKELSKLEPVQAILCNKGIEKPDFREMVVRGEEIVFKKKLLWVLGDKYDDLAQMQFEIDEPGFMLNLLQLTLRCRNLVLFEWMLDEILPKCSKEVQKSIIKTDEKSNAVEMLARQLNFTTHGLVLAVDKPEEYKRISNDHPLLKKLVSFYNRLTYPDNPNDQLGKVYYILNSSRFIPDARDKESFLQFLLESK